MKNVRTKKFSAYAKVILSLLIFLCGYSCFAQQPTSSTLTNEERAHYMKLFSQLNKKIYLLDSIRLSDTARMKIIRYPNSAAVAFYLDSHINKADEDGRISQREIVADQQTYSVRYDTLLHILAEESCCGLGPSLSHKAYFKDDRLAPEIYYRSGNYGDPLLEIYNDTGLIYKYTYGKGIVQVPDPAEPGKMIVIVQNVRELIKAKSYETIKAFGSGNKKRTLVKIISDSSAKLNHYLQEYMVVFNKADLKTFIKSPKTCYLQLVTPGNNGLYFDDCTNQSFKLYSFVVSVEGLGISEGNISSVFFVSSPSWPKASSSPLSKKLNSFDVKNKTSGHLRKLLKRNHMNCKKEDGKEIFRDDVILYLNKNKLK